ncbi:hypothetical protein F511_25624 [Dorcoceras hygrometricum]|uniref:Uncharacterized protein n=1 Tax=Dorcoceras hygrometricum TaxID=472368 RepID=A0A2Z7AUM6_9LAMI|nr:hypothetical protein F511_25624 [Dorcoceras hygrometricum]
MGSNRKRNSQGTQRHQKHSNLRRRTTENLGKKASVNIVLNSRKLTTGTQDSHNNQTRKTVATTRRNYQTQAVQSQAIQSQAINKSWYNPQNWSMIGFDTTSSACTRRPEEISTNGFSSSNWPEKRFPARRAAAAAAHGGGGGGREERGGGF